MVKCKTKICKKRKNLDGEGFCPECVAKRNSDPSVYEYNCPSCEKKVGDDECSMFCNLCELWFHIDCVQFPKAVYDILSKHKDLESIKWFCPTCKPKSEEALEKYCSLERKTETLSEDMITVKNEVETLKTTISNIVKKEIFDGLGERQEIERRKMNLVVYGLPEPDIDQSIAWDTDKKVQHDTDTVRNIFVNELGAALSPREGIVDSRRLGKKTDDRPRPLKLVFNNMEAKRFVLVNAKNLRNSTDPIGKKLFVNPDLTPSQRKIQHELREEMWKQRENGKNAIISKGKIIEASVEVNKVRKVKPTTSKSTVTTQNRTPATS